MTGSSAAPESGWHRWIAVAGVSLVSAGLAAYEIAPASISPVVRESLGVGPTAAGLLVGVVFGTIVISSVPVGVALDRTGSRGAIGVAVLALAIAGVWGWWAGERGDVASLLTSRVLGGLASAVVWNAGIDVVSRLATAQHRATAVGVFTASGPLGFAVGQATAPVVAARAGWAAVFPAAASVGVLGLAVFWPASRGLRGRTGAPPSLREVTTVIRSPAVLQVATLGFLAYSLYLFLNAWGPSYLTEDLGLALGLSGLLVAAFPATGVLARTASGLVSDRLFGGRRRPVVLLTFAVSAPVLVVFTHLETVPILFAALLVAGFAVHLTLALSYSYVQDVVAPNVRATAVAFQTSAGLAGAFLAPVVGGVVVDAAGYDAAFLLASGIATVGFLVASRAPEPA
ncbi:MAG: MFS transporter [Haloarculaceae archaeon]